MHDREPVAIASTSLRNRRPEHCKVRHHEIAASGSSPKTYVGGLGVHEDGTIEYRGKDKCLEWFNQSKPYFSNDPALLRRYLKRLQYCRDNYDGYNSHRQLAFRRR